MSSLGVSLVTGAAQGIGHTIALRLADDGFDVAVNDIPSKLDKLEALRDEIHAKGHKSHIVLADVSVEEQVKNMVASVVEELGGLDVMIANAGLVLWTPFLESKVEDIDRLLSVNVRGTMLCYKYAGIQMVAQGRGGRIIGACSVAGKKGFPMCTTYCATKFAVRGITQSVAQVLGKHGITVNAYAPGTIQTEMLQYMDNSEVEISGVSPGTLLKSLGEATALGHGGTTAEVASLVSYLVSKEAHFITGQSVSCDGGWNFD